MFSDQDKTANATTGKSTQGSLSSPSPHHTQGNHAGWRSLAVFFLAASVLCGCNVSNKPNLALWKKDNFKLSSNHSEGVAPPSRSFDPAPSQLASASQQSDGSGSRDAAKPIRQPYGSGNKTKPAEQVASNGFGFPEGSKTLFGSDEEKKDFSLPDAQDFRNAMKNATQESNQIAGSATRSAENAFQSTRDLSADTFNKAMSPLNKLPEAKSAAQTLASNASQKAKTLTGGGDFVASPTPTIGGANTVEVAGQFDAGPAKAPADSPNAPASGWNDNFRMSPSAQRVQNQFVGSDFDASVKQATEQAKASMKRFNQNALDRFNTATQSDNNYAATTSPNFQSDAVSEPAPSPAPAALADALSNQFRAAPRVSATDSQTFTPPAAPPTPPVAAPTNQIVANQFVAPPVTAPTPPAVQPATNASPRNDFAQVAQNDFESQPIVLPKRHVLPTATPDELARKAQQMRERLEGITEPAADVAANAIQATNDVIGNADRNIAVGFTQGDGKYPTTNYAAYSGRERISQVTPIAPINPIQQAPAINSNSTLPLDIIKGNGSYAPGSVKSLAPVQ